MSLSHPELTASKSREDMMARGDQRSTDKSPRQSDGNANNSSSMPKKSRKSGSAASPSSEKQVQWAANLESVRLFSPQDKPSSLEARSNKNSSQKSKSRATLPPAPEPPRSPRSLHQLQPPPAPRPRRLPSPDLSPPKHGRFCSCCEEPSMATLKMNAQMAAASKHMSKSHF